MTEPLLKVENLVTAFKTERGAIRAVDDISFTIQQGQTVGLVGESGCGKSVTSLSILRLITPPGQITGGSVHFDGQDLLTASEAEMQKIRGNRIAMIFQQPNSSLNPVQKLANQIGEVLRIHKGLDEKAATVFTALDRLSPNTPNLLRPLAVARDRLGDHAKALEALDRLAMTGAIDPQFHALRAKLLGSLDRWDEAKQAMNASLQSRSKTQSRGNEKANF